MGKSGNKKKKPAGSAPAENPPAAKPDIPATGRKPSVPSTASQASPPPAIPSASKMEQFTAVFLRRAHELKEDGNRRFQSKDYQGAMERYEQALRLTPRNHPDRAIFHSNRAACLMQMKPIQYEAVVSECSHALEVHPRFGRALFRRARALEALGKLELALQDVQLLLQGDSNHQDGLELAKRLRIALGGQEEAQQDTQGRSPPAVSYAGTSPAAVGASVVRGSPVASRGPSLPARPLIKKKGAKPEQPSLKVTTTDTKQNGPSSPASPHRESSEPQLQVHRPRTLRAKEPLQEKVSNGRLDQRPNYVSGGPSDKVMQSRSEKAQKKLTIQNRPLKLIYDHDIRLAQVPGNCSFRALRELVRKRFPASKAVLIKYRDMEGDLVTITCTDELRLAEAAASSEAERKKIQGQPTQKEQNNVDSGRPISSPSLELLRLYVVEVPIEQEPIVEEEETMVDANVEETEQGTDGGEVDAEVDDSAVVSSDSNDLKSVGQKGETGEDSNGKEFEIDEWLLDFAQLFRSHIGLDPDAHIDLHELGMEFCTEALEETVTSEEAQPLFEAAACKFQEVAALAFFNWGNVHMCAARKRIPLEESSNKVEFHQQLQAAFDWAQGQYQLAKTKYEEALCVKPDFYEGVLALGQESFESAKLRWSLAVSSQVDLSTWDSSETLGLFSNAEEKMQLAANMWEKLEDQRLKELKGSLSAKKDLLKSEARGLKDPRHDLTEAEIREQFLVMRYQINLFWGNILFEHSQVEFKLGLPLWKEKLDAAVQKFELAGASPSDIAVVLKNHVSNPGGPCGSALCQHKCGVREKSEAQGVAVTTDGFDSLKRQVQDIEHGIGRVGEPEIIVESDSVLE